MTLKEFLSKVNKLVEENPKALDYQVVTSMDDEGNGFNPVFYDANIGVYRDRKFVSLDSLKEYGYKKKDVNAVCLN